MRVLPRINEEVNEEWISDKTRYACDGLMRQRLDRPYVRTGGKLQPATWAQAFDAVVEKLKSAKADRVGVIAGDLQDAESMKAALDLFGSLGVTSLDCRQDGAALDPKAGRTSYLFNSSIAGIDEADHIVLIGVNPRHAAPVLNARIRRAVMQGTCKVSVIGEQADLTYGYDYLGAGPETLTRFAAKPPKGAAKPMLIVGAETVARADGAAVLALVAKAAKAMGAVKDGWSGFNILHTAASRVGGLDMGFVPGEGGLTAAQMVQKGALDVLVLMGADEIDLSASDAFVIYMGTHGDAGAHRADVILPGAAYSEKAGLYVNTEGRVQMASRAVFPKGDAKEDWAILRALSERLGKTLPYDSLNQLRAKLFADHPTFGQIDYVATGAALDLAAVGAAGDLSDAAFAGPAHDFYLTNPIARASVTMAECSATAKAARVKPVAAE
jgi:NADH-quinone oxidoreductase subunit G